MTIQDFKDNKEAILACTVISRTTDSVFLTGKAGTGKSTLLKTILDSVKKKVIVCAPTGISAKNVRGVTLHSFFKLPIGVTFSTDSKLSKIYYTEEQVLILRTMQVLVIDEISMVPSYLLDCIDSILRYMRGNDRPFGGVQIFLVGDPFQLPPVVKNEEKDIIAKRYDSELFFDSDVFKRLKIYLIELKKCYRQNDEEFMNVLDTIRTKDVTLKALKFINENCVRKIDSDKELVITLTPTNRKADLINTIELSKIDKEQVTIPAIVTGSFDSRSCIADELLCLKEGAHVMFLKNQPNKGYFNGTMGIVLSFDLVNEKIIVKTETDRVIELGREIWEEIEYHLSDFTDEYEKRVIGSMCQFPIKLAFACTIHKSQGLTFQKMILDTDTGAFAAGQIYVALSRCRSLDGIYLEQRVMYKEIIIDRRVKEFYKTLEK